jgi:hypothetical protein
MKRIAILMLTALAGQAAAAAPSRTPPRSQEYRPLEHLGQGFADVVSPANLPLLGLGVGLTVISFYFDERWANHVRGRDYNLGGLGDFAVSTKTEVLPMALAGGALIFGLLGDSQREIDAGQAQLEAIVAYSSSVATLKFLTYRNGANDSLHHAFPSGQVLFVTAGSVSRIYGFGYSVPLLAMGSIGVVDYALKGGHWLSDLVFGSFLGFTMGAAFTDHHRAPDEARPTVRTSFYPVAQVSPETGTQMGLLTRFEF